MNNAPPLTMLTRHLRKLLHSTFNIMVLAYILVAMVSLLITLNFIYLQAQQRSLREHITDQGRLMARMLAHNCRLGVFAENPEMLKGPVEAVLKEEGVIEAAAYTPDGGRLYLKGRQKNDEAFRDDAGSPDRETRRQLLAGVTPLYRELDERFVFWAPVLATSQDALYFGDARSDDSKDRIIGLVSIVMDKSFLHAGMKSILLHNFLVALVFLAIAALVAFLVMQEVTAPLRRLIATIRKHDIKVESTDELGYLEDTFDALVKRLGDSFATVNELKEGLEKKVLELELEVTERQQAETALRESEETARVLLNAPTHVALLMNRDGVVLDANEPMAARFGKEIDAIIGTCFWDLRPGDEVMRQRRLKANQVLRQGKPLRFEDERQGTWFDNVFYPVRDSGGRVSKVAILSRDITKRVQAERQRRDMEVKTLAQAKLASLGEIATGIAHEINQPLSFIKIIYESILRDLARDQLDLEELKEDCAEALRQLGRITNIVNHLRTFGRSDTMSMGAVRLETVLNNTMILMAERIKLRNITFSPDVADDLPAVLGNDIKLEQVFINLFQNSIDALAEVKEARIAITVRQRHGAAEIRFEDNGPGISPDMAEKIFEPFFTTKEEGQGTGLGLAIIYSIIKEHRGTVQLESPEGGGIVFVITLPLWREEIAE